MKRLTSVELCAGAGGQALGLERAGFTHLALVELDHHACETLRHNRPNWNVVEADLRSFDGHPFEGVDLLAAGVPCPPFSKAGRQLGHNDERDLFPEVLRITGECKPRAVMIENVRGLLDKVFDDYRERLASSFARLGYVMEDWRLLQASDYGVPQLRPRAICVGLRAELAGSFEWLSPLPIRPPTVGEALLSQMSSRGWRGARKWASKADRIAPTLVGGSKKHGGPDLGPTRAKREWAGLGVDALSLAEEAPGPNHKGLPRLTVGMAAILQGFPDDWQFQGKKTPAYRQVGNAFPPPVAEGVALSIRAALLKVSATRRERSLPNPRQLRLGIAK